jgi:Icc-related predicted phosphoesterase
MRILFSSDFHANRPALDLFAESLAVGPYDLGIIAGDILDDFGIPSATNETTVAEKEDAGGPGGIVELETSFKETLAAVGKPVLVIPGNHDPTPWNDYGQVLNIHGKRYELDGYAFVGYRWTSLERTEEEQRDDLEALRSLMSRNTILVTHSPAYGILDHTNYDSIFFGSKALARFVRRTRPRFHLFGHVHGAFGQRWRAVNGSYPNARAFFDIDPSIGRARKIPAEVAMDDPDSK